MTIRIPFKGIVCITVKGEIADEDLVELYRRIRLHDSVEPISSLLIDLREAKGSNITSAGVRELARLPSLLAPESRRAVVVPSSLGFGMVRMYDLWRGGESGSFRAFRDFDEAREWLSPGPG